MREVGEYVLEGFILKQSDNKQLIKCLNGMRFYSLFAVYETW